MAETKDPKATYIDYSARAWSTTADGIFAEAGQILDRTENKDQQAINAEVKANLARIEGIAGSAAAGAYVFKGSLDGLEDLLLLKNVKVGDVYNIQKAFSLSGGNYPAGTNVAATKAMSTSVSDGWDALGGTVDMEAINAKIKTATDTANTASSNASTAIQTANTASGKADAASQKAATAESTANAAKTTAEQAEGTATVAQNAATDAVNKANVAQTTATEANKTAGLAKTTAESAEQLANNALLTFDGEIESAEILMNSAVSITAIKWVKNAGKFAGVSGGKYYASWADLKRPYEIYGLIPRNVVYFNNVDKKLYVINSVGSLVSVSEVVNNKDDKTSTDKALSAKATHDAIADALDVVAPDVTALTKSVENIKKFVTVPFDGYTQGVISIESMSTERVAQILYDMKSKSFVAKGTDGKYYNSWRVPDTDGRQRDLYIDGMASHPKKLYVYNGEIYTLSSLGLSLTLGKTLSQVTGTDAVRGVSQQALSGEFTKLTNLINALTDRVTKLEDRLKLA